MYYQFWVASNRLKKSDALTYQSDDELYYGQIVRVPLGNKTAFAVALKPTSKPDFDTKDILGSLNYRLGKDYIKWLQSSAAHYAASTHEMLSMALPTGLNKNRRIKLSKPEQQINIKTLNQEQISAIKKIEDSDKPTLLYGKTGSGKTRVYIELAKRYQKSNKSSIILVPEIGLSAQVVKEFATSLEHVFVVHSELTEAERHKVWEEILACPNSVVVGPRSALFSPIQNLGLIVIDEEHEAGYKQENLVSYHAISLAAIRAKISKAKLVLASATPRVEDRYFAEVSKLNMVRMTENATGTEYQKHISLIDIKDRVQFAQSSILSKKLIESIAQNLNNNRQSLVFHARRGTSTSVICKDCAWVASCPNCDLPLTHHRDWSNLICHLCNHKSNLLTSCPQCKSTELNYRGIGTKRVVDELKKHFPNANIARFDSDNLKQEKLAHNMSELKSGEIDILVGTHGIAKGLDLPKLKTVGIINADTLLNIPDFNASEKAFQTIYQLAGRVSRHSDGELIIQSYDPTNPVLLNSANQDYEKFYSSEIKMREIASYPPHSYLLKLTISRASAQSAKTSAVELAQNIRSNYQVQVLGPASPLHARTGNQWHMQLIVKSKKRSNLVDIVLNEKVEKYDLDPTRLL